MELTFNGVVYTTSSADFTQTYETPDGTVTATSTAYYFDASADRRSVGGSSLKDATATLFIRPERDKRLTETDWRMSMDYPYDDQTAWMTYRTALRDLPSAYVLGEAVNWPTKP